MTTHTDAHAAVGTAKTWLTRAIIAVVEQTAPDQFTQSPVYVGAQRPGRAPEPLAGLAPALLLSGMAESIARSFATQAREQGATWEDVATAAGFLPHAPGYERAEQAYEWAAGHRDSWNARVTWRCGACDKRVTDRGPYNGHPDDCEAGHADTCPRHLADLAAYRELADD